VAVSSEVPEADAAEQGQDVVPADHPSPPSDDIEAPEADAYEQSQPVPMDEDEGRDG
jgi:hypothetical protein